MRPPYTTAPVGPRLAEELLEPRLHQLADRAAPIGKLGLLEALGLALVSALQIVGEAARFRDPSGRWLTKASKAKTKREV